jgi:hypothetical protein
MKFVVGIMLTSFGTFWGAEGAGVHWPGNDAALLVLVPAFLVISLAYTALLKRGSSRAADGGAGAAGLDATAAAEAQAAPEGSSAEAPPAEASAAEVSPAESARPSGKPVS